MSFTVTKPEDYIDGISFKDSPLLVFCFSICFEWACQNF